MFILSLIKMSEIKTKEEKHNEKSKERKQMQNVCSSDVDAITQEDYRDNSVIIYTDKKNIGKPQIAECYLRNTLYRTFTAKSDNRTPPVTVWHRLEQERWVEQPKTERVYKLPLSNTWITGESARKLICSKNRIFLLKQPPIQMKIGSSFGVSQLHGDEHKVYEILNLDSVGDHSSSECKIITNTNFKIPVKVDYKEDTGISSFRQVVREILNTNYIELINIVNDIDYENMKKNPESKLYNLQSKINHILKDKEDPNLDIILRMISECITKLESFFIHRDSNLEGNFLVDRERSSDIEEKYEDYNTGISQSDLMRQEDDDDYKWIQRSLANRAADIKKAIDEGKKISANTIEDQDDLFNSMAEGISIEQARRDREINQQEEEKYEDDNHIQQEEEKYEEDNHIQEEERLPRVDEEDLDGTYDDTDSEEEIEGPTDSDYEYWNQDWE